jgi:hypothetical protein
MIKKFLSLAIGLLCFGVSHAQRNCGATEHMHALEQAHPEVIQNRLLIEQHT